MTLQEGSNKEHTPITATGSRQSQKRRVATAGTKKSERTSGGPLKLGNCSMQNSATHTCGVTDSRTQLLT